MSESDQRKTKRERPELDLGIGKDLVDHPTSPKMILVA